VIDDDTAAALPIDLQRGMGLPWRFAVLTAMMALVLVVGATEVAVSWSARSRIEDQRMEALTLGNALATYLTRAAPSGDSTLVAAALDDWSGHRISLMRTWAFVRRPDGLTPVAAAPDASPVEPDSVDVQAMAQGQSQVHMHDGRDPGWHVAVPVGAPRTYGVADVRMSTRRLLDWERLERQRAYFVAFISALLVALGVAVLTARWIGRPLSELGRAMAGAHRGAEGSPAAPEIGPREFRILARRYNRLREALTSRERENAARAALLSLQEHARGLERLAVVQQTAAGLAHEIGTPLNTVNGHLQLLRDDLDTARQAAAADRVRLLLTQVERVAGIVRAGLERGTWPMPQTRSVDLGAVSSRILRFLEPSFAEAGVIIAGEIPPAGAARAWCDPQLVEQILLNLLKNAIEALAPGQHVSVTTAVSGQAATIEIADDGPGLTEEARRQLFQPFSTTKGSGGMGLGLAVSRRLARALGGDLEHVPTARGTRWRLTLPAAA
jgi:two-component system, NtrC family, sensor kinase